VGVEAIVSEPLSTWSLLPSLRANLRTPIFGTQRNSFLIRYQIRLATCLDTELLFPLLILGLLLLCYRIAKSGVNSHAFGGVSKNIKLSIFI
jgi:hypothetical protein